MSQFQVVVTDGFFITIASLSCLDLLYKFKFNWQNFGGGGSWNVWGGGGGGGGSSPTVDRTLCDWLSE